MASVQRTRSLRRPAPVPSEPPKEAAPTATRNTSPSRLPVNFHSRGRSTVTGNDTKTTAPSVKARPTSTILARSSANKTTTTSNNGASEPPKREVSRYPPSTTLTRPQTGHARPGSSGSTAPPKRVTTHTRAKSTTTSVSQSTVLRPPSRDKATGPAARTAPFGHRRNASVDKSNISNAVHTPTKPNAQAPQPRLKPAFSTLQQHYSPAKTLAPKPLTATYLAPPSPSKLPANLAASAETNRLQAEVLQLHLLHRDAAVVEKAWRDSARTKLGARFDEVDEASREIAALERDRAEVNNFLALRKWAGEDNDLDQKIQALDAVTNGVWTLSEAGGRYARIVRRFGRWIDLVGEIEETRKSGTALTQGDGNLFISELEANWKEDRPGLIRRLDNWRLQLHTLGSLPESTNDGSVPPSLIRMVRSCDALIRSMLGELTIMEEIEQEALEREDEWIERANREDDDDDDTPRAGAIWRTFNDR